MGFAKKIWPGLIALATATTALSPAVAQQPQKPNILVIMADDIGYWNISAYNRGMMGYRTPNIDRIANEGAIFTDYYGQQSCTAGRSAFITDRVRCGPDYSKWVCLVQRKGYQQKIRPSPNFSSPKGTSPANSAESSWRSKRIPADRARLRRILRQPLPSECRGRAGTRRLSEESSIQGAVRSARCDEMRCDCR